MGFGCWTLLLAFPKQLSRALTCSVSWRGLRTTKLLQYGAERGLTLHEIGPSRTEGRRPWNSKSFAEGLILYRDDPDEDTGAVKKSCLAAKQNMLRVDAQTEHNQGALEGIISRCWLLRPLALSPPQLQIAPACRYRVCSCGHWPIFRNGAPTIPS